MTRTTRRGAQQRTYSKSVPLIIFIGESNSGGVALNSDLPAGDLLPRPAVQILNNVTMLLEPLQMGVNNCLNHTGFTNGSPVHGWERGLVDSVEAGEWLSKKVYLLKCGQGGSAISQWGSGGAYWLTALARIDAAMAQIRANGDTPVPFVWLSIGINDGIAATDPSTWNAAVTTFIGVMRAKLGRVPVLMSRVMSPTYDLINAQIAAIGAADPLVIPVQVQQYGFVSVNHWDSRGMKRMANAFIRHCVNTIGEGDGYARTIASIVGGATKVAWGAPVHEFVPVAWTSLGGSATADSAGRIISNGTAGGGGLGPTIDTTKRFEVEMVIPQSSITQGAVVFLDTDSGTDFAFTSGNGYVSGIYQAGTGLWYVSIFGGNGTSTGQTIGGGTNTEARIRMRGDASVSPDVIYSYSTDGGLNFTDFYTHTSRLGAGSATSRLKAMFAINGSSQIAVSVRSRW